MDIEEYRDSIEAQVRAEFEPKIVAAVAKRMEKVQHGIDSLLAGRSARKERSDKGQKRGPRKSKE